MMMSINAFERLDTHPEKACSLPYRYARLHEPGRRGMAEGVRSNTSIKPGQCNGSLEGGFYRFDGSPVPLDEMRLGKPLPVPTPKMRKQPPRNRNGRLSFVGSL